MMTSAIGWICCGLGAATGIAAALGALLAFATLNHVVGLIAVAITFFGVGLNVALTPEAGRRGARAVQQAFDFGIEYCRSTHGPPRAVPDLRDDAA
jgi:hypothetical protein